MPADSPRAQGFQGAVHKVTAAALRAYAAGGGKQRRFTDDQLFAMVRAHAMHILGSREPVHHTSAS